MCCSTGTSRRIFCISWINTKKPVELKLFFRIDFLFVNQMENLRNLEKATDVVNFLIEKAKSDNPYFSCEIEDHDLYKLIFPIQIPCVVLGKIKISIIDDKL